MTAHSPWPCGATVHMHASNALPGTKWTQVGDLRLKSDVAQRALDLTARDPCPAPTWMFKEPVLATGTPATPVSMMAQYSTCNDTAVLDAEPPLWSTGVADTFEAELTVRVPPQLHFRQPNILETLKLAWVQYLAILWPCWLLLNWLYGAMFRFGVVASRVRDPVKQHRF